MPVRLALAFRPILVLCLAVMMFGGCAKTHPPNRTVRLAVLDGETLYPVAASGETIRKGWWFGARNNYISPNVNVLVADALADDFSKIPGVSVYSREDLEIYMAQKERLVKRNYPDLGSRARKELLNRQPALDYGRSLNVDYVLKPQVIESKTVTNRTFSWWYSKLDVAVELWDVSSGEMLQRWVWKDQDNFDSQLAMAKECAREIARKARRTDAFGLYTP